MAAGKTYEPIATFTTNGSTQTYTFGASNTLPQTYTDLILVVNDINSTASFDSRINFNSSTSAIYSRTGLRGSGSVANSYYQTGLPGFFITSDGSANNTKPSIVHIMSYSNSTTYKTILVRSNDASTGLSALVQLWRSTAAVTQIDFYTSTAMASGGTLTLYGIAAA